MTDPALAGLRIMVVEDEFLVSMMIETILEDEACKIIGPYTNITDALSAVRQVKTDCAFLDVNLHDEKIYPVAEILAHRGIPFVLLTGYGESAVPENRPGWHVCTKPFTPDQLITSLKTAIATASSCVSHA